MERARVNGVQLAYVDRGGGRPVVLAHGFPLDHGMWQGQIEALAADYRVIAADFRGFGQSGLADDPAGGPAGGVSSMRQMAEDLAALLNHLAVTEPVVLCGLSMGGYVAFQFQRAYPRRLAGLILCDTRAVADSPEAAAGRLKTAEQVLRDGPHFLIDAMLPKLLSAGTRQGRPDIVAQLEQTINACQPRGIAAAARGMAERPDVTGWLKEIACPTLVIVGQEDPISPPAEMRGIAAAIAGAIVAEIPGAGHMSPLEQPAAVNRALLAFLAGLE